MVRGRFNSHHILRLRQISNLHGFTGVASAGVAIEGCELGSILDDLAGDNVGQIMGQQQPDLQEEEDLQNEQEEEEEEEQLNNDLLVILTVSMDSVSLTQ